MADTNHEFISSHEFISRKISDAFEELTETVAEELAKKYGEDMPVGSLAFEIMAAETYLQNEWDRYTKSRFENIGTDNDVVKISVA